jgi:O-acetyl-ADP-ribose deacetylase (regulator of RNase III)
MQIVVWQGDITRCEGVDAVVNAANEALAAGGGVCGAIFRAAGDQELSTACGALGGCATGDAKVTPAFGLSRHGVTWIVHAVGPRWHGGDQGEPELLASAYRRAMDVAAGTGARSIAFPMLSAGIYGYPADEAAEIGVRAIKASGAAIDRVVLVAYDEEAAVVWERAIGEA